MPRAAATRITSSTAATGRPRISRSATGSRATTPSTPTTISCGASTRRESTPRTRTGGATRAEVRESYDVEYREKHHERYASAGTGSRTVPAHRDAGGLRAVRARGGDRDHVARLSSGRAAGRHRRHRRHHRGVREAWRSRRDVARVALPLADPDLLVLAVVGPHRSVLVSAPCAGAGRIHHRPGDLDRDLDLGALPADQGLPAVQGQQAGPWNVGATGSRAA